MDGTKSPDRLDRYRFRADPANGGKPVTGYFKRNRQGDCYIEDESGLAIVVAPDTVVPLVGHDMDGREVFEGDWLQDDLEGTFYKVFWDEDCNGFFLDAWGEELGLNIGYVAVLRLDPGPDDRDSWTRRESQKALDRKMRLIRRPEGTRETGPWTFRAAINRSEDRYGAIVHYSNDRTVALDFGSFEEALEWIKGEMASEDLMEEKEC